MSRSERAADRSFWWMLFAVIVFGATVAVDASCAGLRHEFTGPPTLDEFHAIACHDPLPDGEPCWMTCGSPAWTDDVAARLEQGRRDAAEVLRLQAEIAAHVEVQACADEVIAAQAQTVEDEMAEIARLRAELDGGFVREVEAARKAEKRKRLLLRIERWALRAHAAFRAAD